MLHEPGDRLCENTHDKSRDHFKIIMCTEYQPRTANHSGHQYGQRKIKTGSKGIDQAEKNKKADQSSHGHGMKADFEKNSTHPGAANREKGAQDKMSNYRWCIRKIAEYIVRPEIKEHGKNKTNEPVLTAFQLNRPNQAQSPGKGKAQYRKDHSKEYRTDHSKIPDSPVHAHKSRWMDIDQESHYIRDDQQRMK